MLFSEFKKFLFIHIPRTAGTSMHEALKEYEVDNLEAHSRWFLEYIREKKRFPPHLTFRGATATLKTDSPKNDLKDYFCFAFVRNPWERYVSLWIYFRRMKRHVMHEIANRQNFLEFIEDVIKGKTLISQFNNDGRPQYDYYLPLSYRELDFIGRFETLEKDWAYVCKVLEVKKDLPQMNMDTHLPYQSYYNDYSRRLVARYCAEEIEKFKYVYA